SCLANSMPTYLPLSSTTGTWLIDLSTMRLNAFATVSSAARVKTSVTIISEIFIVLIGTSALNHFKLKNEGYCITIDAKTFATSMLTKIMRMGYWAAQEQHSMQQLLDFVVEAERAG